MLCSVTQCVWLFATPWNVDLLCHGISPGKNIGVGCYFLLPGIFLTQWWDPCLLCLLHWQADSLPLRYLGSCILRSLGSKGQTDISLCNKAFLSQKLFIFFFPLKKKKIHASFIRFRMHNTFWLKIIMNQQLVLNYSKWLANVLSFTISCLENSMDRGAWQAAVHGVAESDMTEQLSTHAWLNF